jgi:hypothetical protein
MTPRKPQTSSFSSIFCNDIPTNTFWAPSERVGGLVEAAPKLDEDALEGEKEGGGGAVVVLVPENATGSVSPTNVSSFLRISSANHVLRSTDLERDRGYPWRHARGRQQNGDPRPPPDSILAKI